MQEIFVYDPQRRVYDQIINLELWDKRQDYSIANLLKNREDLLACLNNKRPEALIYVIEKNSDFEEEMNHIMSMFAGIKVILLGYNKTMEATRKAFISGAFDYLAIPVSDSVMEQSIVRVNDVYGVNYIVTNLRVSINALIDNIFLGGGQERMIICGIIHRIFDDWKRDTINGQILADKAKNQAYNIMIERKPWLEKFLNRKDFSAKFGFAFVSQEKIIEDWYQCFLKASKMVRKYQMIDDKLVYRIGKYVVVHVDEKLTLESVAKGVYLNPAYVSHIFKEVTDMSFVDFMTEVKIDRTKILLQNPQAKIYDIASIVGYSNAEYFSKIFKKKTGMTPTAYQKMVCEQAEM